MAHEFKLLQPLQYHQQFLSNGIRTDGRDFNSFRPILINSGSITTADGSSVIKLGNTSVICGLKSEISEPNPESPDKGIINVNVDLPPLCSSKYRPFGTSNNDSFVVTQLINDIIRNCEIVNRESLCIVKNKFVWNINAEVICLNYDGNVFDACLAVILASLKCGSLPIVNIKDNDEISFDDKTRVPIEVCGFPIGCSFAFIDDKILSDPNSEEETLSDSLLTIVTNADTDEINLIHKPGGASISESQIETCVKMAKERSKHIKALIVNSLNTIKSDFKS